MSLIIILSLSIIIIIMILDISMRYKNVNEDKIRYFETSSLIIFLIFLVFATKNVGVLTIIGTTLISMAWVFKELFANLGATIVMHVYPQFEKDDIITMEDKTESYTFKDVGFLRSVLKKTNGDLVFIPNRTLLNEFVTVS